MELTFSALMALLRETLRDPRSGAQRVMAVNMPDAARWQALALVVVLSVLLVQLAIALVPGGDPEMAGPAAGGAFRMGIVQGVALLLTVVAVHYVGRAFGGTGMFRDALILLAWLQFVTLCFQVMQIISMLIFPPLSSLVAIASVAVFLWLLVSFIQTLHGFESRGKVLLGIVLSFFGLAFVLSLVLAMLGISVPGAVE